MFQYWTIIPLEHLLARLAVDSESVCKRIINLIFNNFVPIDASSELGDCMNNILAECDRAFGQPEENSVDQGIITANVHVYYCYCCNIS